jgi:hypothetical protein
VTDVQTGTVTKVPARLGRMSWVKANPRYRCAVLFSALVGTPRRRESS